MVATERWAVGIRVFAHRGVSVKVEPGVYLAAHSWSVLAPMPRVDNHTQHEVSGDLATYGGIG